MIIKVTDENKKKVRKFYLSLCDQGRANFLYDNMIGGGTIGLAPTQYPKSSPIHRACSCGSEPELKGSLHTTRPDKYVFCPNCGCRSVKEWSEFLAWRSWDMMKLDSKENITIWEV